LWHTSHDDSESITLDTNCGEDNTQRIAFLEQHGFVLQPIRTLRMIRSLAGSIPTPQLPAGFAIRHVAGEHEVEALVTLHRAAFGTEHMTVEERLAMMRTPEYDPALDLIIVAPDGAFAAYCLCTISSAENARTNRKEGHIDPVAVHPAFQRQGLAHALLLAGLHLLKQRGMDTAVLGTSSENVAMQRAAISAGFRVLSTKIWFSKLVLQN
jgi:ribosomal protein S18 acetylase RimI-like enzyme